MQFEYLNVYDVKVALMRFNAIVEYTQIVVGVVNFYVSLKYKSKYAMKSYMTRSHDNKCFCVFNLNVIS